MNEKFWLKPLNSLTLSTSSYSRRQFINCHQLQLVVNEATDNVALAEILKNMPLVKVNIHQEKHYSYKTFSEECEAFMNK